MLVAIALPEIGVHQATDTIQSVHAGYWRGVMAHKITLGIFAGGTLSLLIFHGRTAFRWTWVLFAASALACLINTNSMTAYAGFGLLTFLLAALRISKRQIGAIRLIVLFGLLIVFATAMGGLDWLGVLFDKSTDLTGRADMWPFISAVSASNLVGRVIGYGYVAGMKVFVAPTVGPFVGGTPSDAHNGYLEVLVAFGYLGAVAVLFIHLWLFLACRRLVLNPKEGFEKLSAIPISLFITGALLNYSESLLMSYASHFSVLTPIAAAWAFQAMRQTQHQNPPSESNGRRQVTAFSGVKQRSVVR
jgi:O-antigen ligase